MFRLLKLPPQIPKCQKKKVSNFGLFTFLSFRTTQKEFQEAKAKLGGFGFGVFFSPPRADLLICSSLRGGIRTFNTDSRKMQTENRTHEARRLLPAPCIIIINLFALLSWMFCVPGDRVEPPSSMQAPLVYNSFSAKQETQRPKVVTGCFHGPRIPAVNAAICLLLMTMNSSFVHSNLDWIRAALLFKTPTSAVGSSG